MGSKMPKLRLLEIEGVEEFKTGNWDGLPPELLNMICNQLPIADLLSLSVVSKAWKKASRDVLKRSRECYAYIGGSPQGANDFIDKIASTELLQMVNGLHIQMRPTDRNKHPVSSSSSPPFWRQEVGSPNMCKPKSTETRRKLINVAFSGQMKYLTLDLEDEWKDNLSTDDVSLLQELISNTSDSLQKLVILQDECCDFMSSCGKEFPKLKVAQVEYEKALHQPSFLKEFLTAFAPNLEEITGWMLLVQINCQVSQYMLKRSKRLMVWQDRRNPEVYLEDYQCISGLDELELWVCHCDSFGDNNILFSMLLKSLDTLEELGMLTPEFYNLFKKTSTQLEFPNLRVLSLSTNGNMPVGDEIAILKQLNLPNLCPRLERLQLSTCIDHSGCTDDAYKEEDWTPAALPYGVDQSNMYLEVALKYRGDHYSRVHLEFLHQMYPNINKVSMLNWELGDGIYEMSGIFSDLRSLEFLEIHHTYGCSDALDFQMDALLCGISVEEAEFLFNSCPRTNSTVLNPCIVPIRPSLFNAKNLKELKITRKGPGPLAFHTWVTKITENLPARHERSLKVTFEGSHDLFHRLIRLQVFTTLLRAQARK